MKKSIHFTEADEHMRVLRAKRTSARLRSHHALRGAKIEHELNTADVRALALANELIERAEDEGMSVFDYLQREAAELGAVESGLGVDE